MRAKSDADFKALRFETDIVELGTALLAANRDAVEALRLSIVEQVSELPLGVNLVARRSTTFARRASSSSSGTSGACSRWNGGQPS
ncbi:MAG: hypothetical protein HY700_01740 [Gemmatimonadetes bacterium]|nr:hypothetical protein [Gemmatimonadota bacterium]